MNVNMFRDEPVFEKGDRIEYVDMLKHPKYQGEFEIVGYRRKDEGNENSPFLYFIQPVDENEHHGEKLLRESKIRGRFKVDHLETTKDEKEEDGEDTKEDT